MTTLRDAVKDVPKNEGGGPAGAAATAAIEAVAKPLLQTLGDLAADKTTLTRSLFDEAKSRTTSSFGWDWKLGASADSQMSIDVLDPQEAAARGLQPPDGQVIVAYKWDSALDATASGNQDAHPWKLSANAGASLKATLEWLYSGGNNDTLALAIASAAKALVTHTDLAQMMSLCAESTHFWGATATVNGDLQASLHAEASATATGWTYGFNKDKPSIGFSVSAAGSVGIKLSGAYRLAAVPRKRNNVWGLQVSLERDRQSDKSAALELDAGIDFTALAASAEKFLRANLPDATKLSNQLDLLTQPGAFLRAKVNDLLTERFANPTLNQLALLVLGQGNQADVASALAARVTAPLTDVLDRIAGDINNGSADLVKATSDWIKRAFGDIKISAAALAELQSAVNACIQSITKQADGAIAGLASDLKGKSVEEANRLLVPFGRLGEMIGAELDKIGGVIADATKPIRDAVKAYSDKRNAILAVLQDAQRAKVTAAISISLAETESEQQVFKGWFTTASDGTIPGSVHRLYQALCSGRLMSLDRLVADAQDDHCVLDVECWLLRAGKRAHKEAVAINLFGYQFSDQVTSLIDLKIKTSGGYVVAASGKADLDAQVANYWIDRETELSVSVRLAGDLPLAPSVAVSFAGAFSAKGRDLDQAYIDGMQRSLAVLCGPSRVDVEQLVRQATGTAFPGDRFWRDIAVALHMDLDEDEWSHFCTQGAAAIRRACAGYGMQALDAVYDGMAEFDNARPSTVLLEKSLATVNQPRLSKEDQVASYLQQYEEGQMINRFDFPGTDRLVAWGYSPNANWDRIVRQVRIINRFAQLMYGLVRMIQASGAIADIVARSRGLPPERVFSAMQRQLQVISDAMLPAAVASMTFTAKGEQNVPWPLVTLAATIAQMAGRSVPPGFIPTVSLPGRAEPIPLLG